MAYSTSSAPSFRGLEEERINPTLSGQPPADDLHGGDAPGDSCEILLEDIDSLDKHMKLHKPLGAPYVDIHRLSLVASGQLDDYKPLLFDLDFDKAGITSTTHASIATSSPTSPHKGPTRCDHPGCMSTLARASDLRRHIKSHLDRPKDFHCWHPGCGRNGANGFYRRDKLVAHQKKHL